MMARKRDRNLTVTLAGSPLSAGNKMAPQITRGLPLVTQ